MASSTGWTKDELLLALDLYCQIPFGRMHYRNPEIIQLANSIGRTPSALAMKLSNFASLDPGITASGRTGLGNASAADRVLWEEMMADWEAFASRAQEAKQQFGILSVDAPDELADFTGADRSIQTTARVGQAFFRRAVLSAYDYSCCITGLRVPTLLTASHIVPWRLDPRNRLNPRNGLSLSALHDRAFDAGIITVDANLSVRVTRSRTSDDGFFEMALSAFDGKPIKLPDKFAPDSSFLAYHREHVFLG